MLTSQRTTYLLCFVVALATGCANPYEKFYHDQLGGKRLSELPNIEPHTGAPVLYTTDDMARDTQAMVENGFATVGYSSFNSGPVDASGALAQGKAVGAAMVIVQSRYTHTVTGSIPYTVQNPDQTVTTYTQGNIYGSGGSANFNGTSTSTVPGGTTTYQIPYNVNRSDYLATYWVKRKTPALGVIVVNLPDSIRQKLQTNRGVLAVAIMRGSPAFKADVLKGDVIVGIGTDSIDDVPSFAQCVPKHMGKQATLKIIRDGRKMNIDVTLNSR